MTMRQRKRRLLSAPRRWPIGTPPIFLSGVWTAHEWLAIKRDPWRLFR